MGDPPKAIQPTKAPRQCGGQVLPDGQVCAGSVICAPGQEVFHPPKSGPICVDPVIAIQPTKAPPTKAPATDPPKAIQPTKAPRQCGGQVLPDGQVCAGSVICAPGQEVFHPPKSGPICVTPTTTTTTTTTPAMCGP